jgi:phage baseplate assembly protein W
VPANPPDIPHFAVPFTITAAGANVVEQDSDEEIYGCVRNIVACPIGARSDLPAFGIPDPVFSNAPLDTESVRSALKRWEPRAETVVTESGDLLDVTIRHLRVDVLAAQ